MKIGLNASKMSGVLLRTQNTILSAAFIIAASNALNAGLGLIKSRLLATFFGVSNDLAVFYTADRIPNLIYSVLVVGAVSTVFIPVFASALNKNKEEAFKTASAMANATMAFFLVLTVLVFVFAKQIMYAVALGKFSPEEMILGTNLMRIMLAGQIILVGGSLATSILQTFKYFIIPALAPLAYNIGMIIGIVFLSERFGVYGPALGVIIGASLHFIIQIPILVKTGYKPRLGINLADAGFKKMLALIPPRIASVLLANLIDVVNNSLAILVSTSSVIYLKFATQLQAFPVNLFGVSLAAASLPTLSLQSEKEDMGSFKKTFTTSLLQMLYFVLPLSMILLVLRVPVVRIVYGASKFPWEATLKTSYTLAFFSISIFAQSVNYLVTRAFYALKDTKTPVLVSVFTTVFNIGLSLIFISVLKLEVWSVAFSYSLSSLIDMLVLFYLLNEKVAGFDLKTILKPFTKISYASLIMGIMLYVPLKLLDQYIFDTTKTLNLIVLTGISGLFGVTTYFLLTRWMKVTEIEMLYKLIKKLSPIKKAAPFVQSDDKVV